MPGLEGENRLLNGQVALVTGGGRGIGRSIAQALARAGAHVAVAARTTEQLDETVALVRNEGGQAISLTLDVTDRKGVEQTVSETIRRLGPIDLLVNNAAITGAEAPIWEEDADAWWRVQEVNVRGPFLCARAVLPGMIERKRGRIINVGSGAGGWPSFASAYPVSKAALFRLTDCLAAMAGPYGVSVFAISPGLVHTAMADGMQMFKDVPESEWIPAERAGELCVTLATGKADRLSGRYLHVKMDIDEMVQRADEIIEKDMYTLRLRT